MKLIDIVRHQIQNNVAPNYDFRVEWICDHIERKLAILAPYWDGKGGQDGKGTISSPEFQSELTHLFYGLYNNVRDLQALYIPEVKAKLDAEEAELDAKPGLATQLVAATEDGEL